MAQGSQNLATYIAKRIIGDSTNVNWDGALLHSGTSGKTSTMDTWIFADDYGSTSSTYDILHRQSDDKIVFVGASADRFWNNLNTGDIYINGKLGIGYNPDRIVGTVSCVPAYEEWGGGENADRSPVKVNGRIWVKVR